MYMMHPSCNINTSNNLYDPSRVLDDHCYYYYSSPYLFPSSPSLHHEYTHGDGDNTIQNDFFQDFLVNHNEMIQQKQQIPPENNNNYKNDNNNNNEEDNSKSKRVGFDKINSPRKKISKKDRHTKIETAQGPRDRRMRLSLNIARKFFDLQDMLGFDKASKTVEWLLSKSLSAITDLSKNFQQVGPNSSLSSTNSKIVIMDELSCSNENLENGMADKKNLETKKGNKKVVRTIRPLAKESREKARERARERTLEKKSSLHKRMELAGTSNNVLGNGGSLINEGCWIPSTTSTFFNNCQQNGGIIHGLKIPDLEDLSGNFGEASIW